MQFFGRGLGEDVLEEDPAARGQYVASKTPLKEFFLNILSFLRDKNLNPEVIQCITHTNLFLFSVERVYHKQIFNLYL